MSEADYPDDWPEIARRIKEQAGWECERCGAPHGETPNVLTVHHLDGDKSNVHEWNLAALCQRCHLAIQNKVDWFQDTLTGVHTEWMVPHIEGYNEWAEANGEPTLRLTTVRPNRRPYWEDDHGR